MKHAFVDIHTHRPTGRQIELRTAGVHPWEAARQGVASVFPATEKTGTSGCKEARGGIQAIGEIGLDKSCGVDFEVQQEVFTAQLRIAAAEGFPVVLHCVRAFSEIMHALAQHTPRAVIFHGFIGSPEQAQQALGKGYFLSFGERTFASPKALEAMRRTPLDQLFLETDDAPVSIEQIYTRAAEALHTDVETLQRATRDNYERIFAPQDGQ